MPRTLPENKGKPWNPDRSDWDPDRLRPPEEGKSQYHMKGKAPGESKKNGKNKLATLGKNNNGKKDKLVAAAREKRLEKVKV